MGSAVLFTAGCSVLLHVRTSYSHTTMNDRFVYKEENLEQTQKDTESFKSPREHAGSFFVFSHNAYDRIIAFSRPAA
jgi:hypothetical protein